MESVFLFIHLISAVGLGFYLLLPFVSGQANNLPVLRSMNRIGTYLLIVQFLTGGYLVSKYDLSVAWMVVSIVLLLAIFALTGIMGKKMKEGNTSSVQTLSAVNAVLLVVTVYIMSHPDVI
ncbi:hypothetical protein [Paenibacillus gansuensis]|uniref:Integral membrane protein n=1 Tax=Paenibacillus gansuensis TaxID=306542 RepID=A0ABW5PDM9_9BACL